VHRINYSNRGCTYRGKAGANSIKIVLAKFQMIFGYKSDQFTVQLNVGCNGKIGGVHKSF